ncbi:MAG: hypothetical protein V7L23_36935 [Nostoc sp.]|uniref:hypothetical protein n=1 Tax=Nostoc sp. TaxID=1180 RepID=UPI002FEF81A9
MSQENVTLLCSGASLGAYIPALIASHQLSDRGIASDVVVLENILLENKRNNVSETKFAFHRNFSLALMAQKLAKDITPSIDPDLTSHLLATWKHQERKRFMIFSGFWLPIANRYLQETDSEDIAIDLCHMDASVSTSWKMYDTTHPAFRHVWFFNWEDKRLSYIFCVSDDEPVSYNQRSNRFLIHGGGWGVGTYKSKVPKLVHQGIKLDIIAYEQQDIENKTEHSRYFLIDPTWKPWEKNAQGHHQFPPFGEVKDDGNITFQNSQPYPEVYNLIRQSSGIISKPGGGTLLDSLSAATPLVWLAPYGDYEKNNGLLWEYLGFGISYEKWADSGYSLDILERLHLNLKQARASLPRYLTNYVETYYPEMITEPLIVLSEVT